MHLIAREDGNFDWTSFGNLENSILPKAKGKDAKDDSLNAQGNHSEDEAHKVDMAANKNPVTGERMVINDPIKQIISPNNGPVLKTAYVPNQTNMQVPKAQIPKNEKAGAGFTFKKTVNQASSKLCAESGGKEVNQQINELEYMAAMAQARPGGGDPKLSAAAKPALPKKW